MHDATVAALGAIKTTAEAGTAHDQMLASDNAAGEALVMGGVAALIAQTRAIERAVAAATSGPLQAQGRRVPPGPSKAARSCTRAARASTRIPRGGADWLEPPSIDQRTLYEGDSNLSGGRKPELAAKDRAADALIIE